MVFNSLSFLVFFALFLGIHHLPLSWNHKKLSLLLGSYFFYAVWNPPFVVLLWISTLVDWWVARKMVSARNPFSRKSWLIVSLVGNMGLLSYFKYGNFLLENFVFLAAWLGISYHPPALDIILPVGISFYTFQTLSYTIDVYRGELKPSQSLLDFGFFVAFFPQLVAGPIVRASDFLPQCNTERRATPLQMSWGFFLVIFGLFEKVVLADGILAPITDIVYERVQAADNYQAWLGTLAFAGQIFFDFSDYSTCAIGIALCFGFLLTDNFHFPYAAIGFSDFWRRWHISLSTWLRDYLYISLGGNRRSTARTYLNLALTMLLGGLWHGAAWRFVIWGGLHGAYLVLERGLKHMFSSMSLWQTLSGRFLLALSTFILVCVAWVYFRASQLHEANLLVQKMFFLTTGPSIRIGKLDQALALGVILGTLICHGKFRKTSLEHILQDWPWWLRASVIGFLLTVIAVMSGEDHAFIYFQF